MSIRINEQKKKSENKQIPSIQKDVRNTNKLDEPLSVIVNRRYMDAADKYIEEHKDELLPNGEKRYVKHGFNVTTYFTGEEYISIKKPRIRDRMTKKEVTFLFDYKTNYSRLSHELRIECMDRYLRGFTPKDIALFMQKKYGKNVKGFSGRNIGVILHRLIAEGIMPRDKLRSKNRKPSYLLRKELRRQKKSQISKNNRR
jgi:hypothetical protein